MLLFKATEEELASQIEKRLAHTDKATMIRILATLEDGYDARKSSPFDLLPDELVMKIINMILGGRGKQKRNYLVDIIAMISARFQNLAADKSLWKGHVSLDGMGSMHHIKKPLNAFMLYKKEMRPVVQAECTLKESAAINQILGRRVSVD